MREPRLKLSDPALYPVVAFFNSIWDQDFLKAMTRLTNGIGQSMNDAYCLFYDPDEPDEEIFEGAKFSVGDDEVILSDADWKRYAREATLAFVKANPEFERDAQKLLVKMI